MHSFDIVMFKSLTYASWISRRHAFDLRVRANRMRDVTISNWRMLNFQTSRYPTSLSQCVVWNNRRAQEFLKTNICLSSLVERAPAMKYNVACVHCLLIKNLPSKHWTNAVYWLLIYMIQCVISIFTFSVFEKTYGRRLSCECCMSDFVDIMVIAGPI